MSEGVLTKSMLHWKVGIIEIVVMLLFVLLVDILNSVTIKTEEVQVCERCLTVYQNIYLVTSKDREQ